MNLQHETTALLIITDAVIFDRLANKITDIMNIVIDRDYRKQFHANECYNGFETAMTLMDLNGDEYDNLRYTLLDLGQNLSEKQSEEPYEDLPEPFTVAKEIYRQWIIEINKYELIYKNSKITSSF